MPPTDADERFGVEEVGEKEESSGALENESGALKSGLLPATLAGNGLAAEAGVSRGDFLTSGVDLDAACMRSRSSWSALVRASGGLPAAHATVKPLNSERDGALSRNVCYSKVSKYRNKKQCTHCIKY